LSKVSRKWEDFCRPLGNRQSDEGGDQDWRAILRGSYFSTMSKESLRIAIEIMWCIWQESQFVTKCSNREFP
jgi:hypothetical protein